MKHLVRQFNITEESDYTAYQELMNDDFFSVINESSEFSRDGNYILLVHGVMHALPVKRGEVNSITIFNMAIKGDRDSLENLYSQHRITKEVLNFNKKMNSFQIAVHWVESNSGKQYNNKYYSLED